MSQQWWVVYDLPAQTSLIAVQGTSKGGQVVADGKAYNLRSGPYATEAAAEKWIGAHSSSGAGSSSGVSALNQAIADQLDSQFPGHGYGASFLAWCAANPNPATSVSALALWAQADHIALSHAQLDKVFAAASATGHGVTSVLEPGAASSEQLTPLTGWAGFLADITSSNLWIRGAQVILGLVLIAVGVARATNAVQVATKIAGSIPKVVPV